MLHPTILKILAILIVFVCFYLHRHRGNSIVNALCSWQVYCLVILGVVVLTDYVLLTFSIK